MSDDWFWFYFWLGGRVKWGEFCKAIIPVSNASFDHQLSCIVSNLMYLYPPIVVMRSVIKKQPEKGVIN